MSDSKIYIFSSPPKVELELCSVLCASLVWHTWIWDSKRWAPGEPEELRVTHYGMLEMVQPNEDTLRRARELGWP